MRSQDIHRNIIKDHIITLTYININILQLIILHNSRLIPYRILYYMYCIYILYRSQVY